MDRLVNITRICIISMRVLYTRNCVANDRWIDKVNNCNYVEANFTRRSDDARKRNDECAELECQIGG